MKILKEGNWKNPWTARFVCSHKGCGAELEVDEKDLVAKGYQGESNPWTSIKCGVCGHEFRVPEKEIPPRIQEHLESKRTVYSSSGWRD